MRQDDLVDVEAVSDELYGLPLEEFTAARTVREKQARSAGEKDVAAQIHQLAKPNLVAWLANQLVREYAEEIRPLLGLGAGLREATATLSGEQLRELSRQQRQLVPALVRQARQLAGAAGRKVSPDTERSLEDTLRAALADPDSADALAAGRLTQGMQNSGLGSHPGGDERPARPARKPVTAGTPATAGAPGAARQGTPDRRGRAEHDADQAKSVADEAITVRERAHDLLEAADQAMADAEGRVEQVRRELDSALEVQSGAEKDRRLARAAFDRADRGARDAQRRLDGATDRLARMSELRSTRSRRP